MKKTTISIIILLFLLLSTNILWFLNTIDISITHKYQDMVLYELKNSKKQAVNMLEDTLQDRNKSEIKAIAEKYTDFDSFEKEGCVWIGWYGFKFSKSGKLEGIETDESYSSNPICKQLVIIPPQ